MIDAKQSDSKYKNPFTFSPLLPQSKRKDVYHNDYATKLVPWIEGDQAVHIRVLDLSQRKAVITHIMVVSIISSNPFKYEVVKEPYGTDDLFTLFPKDIFEQVLIAGDQTPRQLSYNTNTERNANVCTNYWRQETFSKLSSDTELRGDGITNIRLFYESLSSTCQATHSLSIKVLPPYHALTSNSTIHCIMIGNPLTFRG